jgi:hypothetical protein
MSIRSTKRPRSARAPLGRCCNATSRSSRPSSISMPGLSPGPVRYRPLPESPLEPAECNGNGVQPQVFGLNTCTAARVRAETPEIRQTGACLHGRHLSARTAFGRLRGIALSDQNHVGILPRPALSEVGPIDSATFPVVDPQLRPSESRALLARPARSSQLRPSCGRSHSLCGFNRDAPGTPLSCPHNRSTATTRHPGPSASRTSPDRSSISANCRCRGTYWRRRRACHGDISPASDCRRTAHGARRTAGIPSQPH